MLIHEWKSSLFTMSKLNGKKILLLVSTDVTFDQRVYRTAVSLRDFGAELHIIGRHLPNSKLINWPGITVHRVSLGSEGGPLMYYQMNDRMYGLGKSQNWDIVVSNDFDTLIAGYRISRKTKAAWILDAHEHFIEVPELMDRQTKRYLWHALGLWAAKRLDAAYTVSESLALTLSLTYKIPFSSIENRPVFIELEDELETEEKLLMYQGALNRGRGLETAIIAMRDMPNYRLEIAGNGDIKDELVALIRRYNLSDRVHLLGRVPPERLGAYTSRAWLGLNLLEGRSLNYYYSLANKFFDYAQWGVPSINPAFPEYKKYIARYGGAVVLEDVNPTQLRKLIFEIEDEEEKYGKLVAGALAMKKDCHWETQIPELEKIYTSVL